MFELDSMCARLGAIWRPARIAAPLAALLAALGLALPVQAAESADPDPDASRNVLVLHSSHRGYQWTDSIMEGIEAVMRAAPEDIELWVEYLDTSRLQSTSFSRQLLTLYHRKYEKVDFDAVITSDRKALEFVLDNRSTIAPGVPIVFFTASNLGTNLADGQPNVTGVSESADFRATLDLAFAMHHGLRHIVFISPGLRSRHLIEPVVADYRPELELSIWHYESLDEIERALGRLEPGAVIVPIGEPVTVGGVAMPMNKFVSWIANRTDAPIYSVWDFALGHGIVGGYLISGFTQGSTIAEIALRALRGESMDQIPIDTWSPSSVMFDYEQLARFGIDEDMLPPDSILINRPVTLYESHSRAVWIAIAVFASLFAVILILGTNVRRRQRAERRLRANQDRFRDFAESAADWFWETDTDMRFTYVSRRSQDVLGVPRDELIGHRFDEVFSNESQDDDFPSPREARTGSHRPFQVQSFWRRPDGVRRVISTSGKPIDDADQGFQGYRGTSRDISDTYDLTEELGYQATHDTLTNLLNRRAFEQRLQTLLSHIKESPGNHALCYLDLDQFKVVNDTCGHVAGDELLKRLAERLHNQVRKRDTVARLGGDEFGVLLEDCPPDRALELVSNLHKCINEFQFVWNDQSFHVGASIGLVPISSPDTTLDELLAAADRACYVAKDEGRNRVHLYRNDEEVADQEGEVRWVNRIQRALEEDRVVICLQPIRALNTDRPVGEHFEVFVRLIDEKGTLVSPSAFLPAAERYNLSTELDRRVLDEGLRYFTSEHERLDRLSMVFINLSSQTFGSAAFLDYILERAQCYNMQPEKLCFEISELTAIRRLEDAKEFVDELRRIGCRFALDDFGRGSHSFRYLKELPVDYVKIDGSFVKNMLNDPMDLVMVRSINDIARLSGAATIAEFVEETEVLSELVDMGVNFAQGFAIGRPTPIGRKAA